MRDFEEDEFSPPAKTVATIHAEQLLDLEELEPTMDRIIHMRLGERDNLAAREEFKETPVCRNLVSAMEHCSYSVDIQWKACELNVQCLIPNTDHQHCCLSLSLFPHLTLYSTHSFSPYQAV
jgi:hypothetical protein